MTAKTTQAVITALREGVAADIWYDAADHDDESAMRVIEATQSAMMEAANLLETLLKQNISPGCP